MGNAKKVALYSVRIDCEGCEKTLAKVLAKIHGVEMFVMDRNAHTLQVTGQIDETEVLKKLKKKKKRKLIELINVKEEKPQEEEVVLEENVVESPRECSSLAVDEYAHIIAYEQNMYRNPVDERLRMFDDENPDACSVM